MIMRLLKRLRTPPDCRKVQAVMQSFLDGELPDSQIHLVVDHLEDCERCGIEREVYMRIKESLRQLATEPEPDALDRLRGFAEDLAEEA